MPISLPPLPRRGLAALVLLAAAATLAAWGTSPPASPAVSGDSPTAGFEQDPAATVTMTNTLSFKPAEATISVGETVKWTNTSVIVHTVTADPEEATLDDSVKLPDGAEPFDSGTLDPDTSFTHTFETPGTYRYFCIPHEGAKMYGTVVVTTE